MKKRPNNEDKLTLEEALFSFRIRLSDVLRREAKYLKYPISQIDALSYIAEKGNPSMKEIAGHLKITPPSVTAIIEAMQKTKLVNRVVNDRDRRTIRITLTPKAWESFRQIKLDIFTKLISKLEDGERKQLVKILNKLVKE
ncbi:MAG: MarR family transcriptional regulator [Minisyncoccia bacterium]